MKHFMVLYYGMIVWKNGFYILRYEMCIHHAVWKLFKSSYLGKDSSVNGKFFEIFKKTT